MFLGASYFRALGKGPALRAVGARPRDRHRRSPRARSSRRFTEFWIERPGAQRDGAHDLRAARFAARHRRLPLRRAARHRHAWTCVKARIFLREQRDASSASRRSPACSLRREPAAAAARDPPRGARLRRPVDPVGHRRMDLASAGQSEAAAGDVVRADQSGGLRPAAARPPLLAATRTSRRATSKRPSVWVQPRRQLGRGPRRARADSDAGRDQRQHRRVLGARRAAGAARAARLRVPAAVADGERRRSRRNRGSTQTRRGHGYRKAARRQPRLRRRLRRPGVREAAPDAEGRAGGHRDSNGEIARGDRVPQRGHRRLPAGAALQAARRRASRSSCARSCAADGERCRRHGATCCRRIDATPRDADVVERYLDALGARRRRRAALRARIADARARRRRRDGVRRDARGAAPTSDARSGRPRARFGRARIGARRASRAARRRPRRRGTGWLATTPPLARTSMAPRALAAAAAEALRASDRRRTSRLAAERAALASPAAGAGALLVAADPRRRRSSRRR